MRKNIIRKFRKKNWKISRKNREFKKKENFLRKFIKKDNILRIRCIFRKNFRENIFREISLRFRIFHFIYFSAKFCEKVCEMRTKMLAFFRETFSSLETLIRGGYNIMHSSPLPNKRAIIW